MKHFATLAIAIAIGFLSTTAILEAQTPQSPVSPYPTAADPGLRYVDTTAEMVALTGLEDGDQVSTAGSATAADGKGIVYRHSATIQTDVKTAATVDTVQNDLEVPAQTFTIGEKVALSWSSQPTSSPQVTTARAYHVVAVTGDEISISETSGGAAVNFSTTGSGVQVGLADDGVNRVVGPDNVATFVAVRQGMLETKGDIHASDGTHRRRLPVGNNDQVLTADATAAEGVAWKDLPAHVPDAPTDAEYYVEALAAELPNARVVDFSGGQTSQILVKASNADYDWIWQNNVGGGGDPLTTKGDLLGFSTISDRIPVGFPGQVLTVDPANPFGITWQTPAGVQSEVRVFDDLTDAIAATDLVNGQVVKTQGYYQPNDGGGNEYRYNAGGMETPDGGFYIDVTAGGQLDAIDQTIGRPLQWGCQLDTSEPASGVMDSNTAGLQACLDATSTIELPAGTIWLNAKITSGQYKKLSGGGHRTSILRWPAIVTGDVLFQAQKGSEYRSFQIYGPGSATAAVGFDVMGANTQAGDSEARAIVKDVWSTDCGVAFAISNSWVWSFRDCHPRNSAIGWHIGRTWNPADEVRVVNDVEINGGEVASCTEGVRMTGDGFNIVFNGVDIEGNTGNGITVEDTAGNFSNVVVKHCYFEGNGPYHVLLEGNNQLTTIEDNFFAAGAGPSQPIRAGYGTGQTVDAKFSRNVSNGSTGLYDIGGQCRRTLVNVGRQTSGTAITVNDYGEATRIDYSNNALNRTGGLEDAEVLVSTSKTPQAAATNFFPNPLGKGGWRGVYSREGQSSSVQDGVVLTEETTEVFRNNDTSLKFTCGTAGNNRTRYYLDPAWFDQWRGRFVRYGFWAKIDATADPGMYIHAYLQLNVDATPTTTDFLGGPKFTQGEWGFYVGEWEVPLTGVITTPFMFIRTGGTPQVGDVVYLSDIFVGPAESVDDVMRSDWELSPLVSDWVGDQLTVFADSVPTDADVSWKVGDRIQGEDGQSWVCTQAGAPGTWAAEVNNPVDTVRNFQRIDSVINATDLVSGQTVVTQGYHTADDGGGNTYRYSNVQGQTEDGGFVINVTAGGQIIALDQSVANVRQFGAKGDGVAEDHTAFRAANEAMGDAGGGVVRIPQGVYYLNGTTNIRTGVAFEGAGPGVTVLKRGATSTTGMFCVSPFDQVNFDDTTKIEDKADITVRNMTMDFNFASQWYTFAPCIAVTNTTNAGGGTINDLLFDNIEFIDSANQPNTGAGDSWCISCGSMRGAAESQNRITFRNCRSPEYHQFVAMGGCTGANDVVMENNYIYRPWNNGISMATRNLEFNGTFRRCVYRNNKVVQPKSIGLWMGPDGSANGGLSRYIDCKIVDNEVEIDSTYGVADVVGIQINPDEGTFENLIVANNTVSRTDDFVAAGNTRALNVAINFDNSTTANAYTQPALGSTVDITFADPAYVSVGTRFLIDGMGFYECTAIAGSVVTSKILENFPHAAEGTSALTGVAVTQHGFIKDSQISNNNFGSSPVRLRNCDGVTFEGNQCAEFAIHDTGPVRGMEITGNQFEITRFLSSVHGKFQGNVFTNDASTTAVLLSDMNTLGNLDEWNQLFVFDNALMDETARKPHFVQESGTSALQNAQYARNVGKTIYDVYALNGGTVIDAPVNAPVAVGQGETEYRFQINSGTNVVDYGTQRQDLTLGVDASTKAGPGPTDNLPIGMLLDTQSAASAWANETLPAEYQTLSSNVTVCMWMNPPSTNSAGSLWRPNKVALEARNTASSGNVPFCLGVSEQFLEFGCSSDYTTNAELVRSSATVQNGTWYHVAVTVSGDDYVMYINGVEDSRGTFATATGDRSLGAAASSICFGAAASGSTGQPGSSHFGGYVADTRIYNATLNAEQIAAIAGEYDEISTGVVNVKDHGAVGDGVADDRPAFQAALDAAASAGGGVVHAPTGVYAMGDGGTTLRLFARNNVSLVGDGPGKTILKQNHGGSEAILMIQTYNNFDETTPGPDGGTIENIEVRDMTMDFNMTGGWVDYQACIAFKNTTDLGKGTIKNVLIDNVHFIDSQSVAHPGAASDAWCINMAAAGEIGSQQAVTVSNCKSYAAGHQFIADAGTGWWHNRIVDNYCYQPHANGIVLAGLSGTSDNRDCIIARNVLDEPYSLGVWIGPDLGANDGLKRYSGITITDNVVIVGDYTNVDGFSAYRINCRDGWTRDCMFADNTARVKDGVAGASDMMLVKVDVNGTQTATTTASYLQPAVGATVAVPVDTDLTSTVFAGMYCTIDAGGFYKITDVAAGTLTVELRDGLSYESGTIATAQTVTVEGWHEGLVIQNNNGRQFRMRLGNCDEALVRGNVCGQLQLDSPVSRINITGNALTRMLLNQTGGGIIKDNVLKNYDDSGSLGQILSNTPATYRGITGQTKFVIADNAQNSYAEVAKTSRVYRELGSLGTQMNFLWGNWFRHSTGRGIDLVSNPLDDRRRGGFNQYDSAQQDGYYAGHQPTFFADQSLDFDLTSANSQSLTITVTGASTGMGVAPAWPDHAGVIYRAVTVNNGIKVTASREDPSTPVDPASATFAFHIYFMR